jgi:hypothetical protein
MSERVVDATGDAVPMPSVANTINVNRAACAALERANGARARGPPVTA